MSNITINKNDSNTILYVDGKPQMIIPHNLATNQKLSEVDFVRSVELLNNKPQIDVLNVGLGAGYTAVEFLKLNNLGLLDIVELYPEMADRLIEFDNEVLLNNRKVFFKFQNIINYVKETDKKYDYIAIDICQPELNASNSVFTYEFLKDVKKITKEDGVFVLWFYKINEQYLDTRRVIMNSLKDIYKNVSMNYCDDYKERHDIYFFASDTHIYNKNAII